MAARFPLKTGIAFILAISALGIVGMTHTPRQSAQSASNASCTLRVVQPGEASVAGASFDQTLRAARLYRAKGTTQPTFDYVQRTSQSMCALAQEVGKSDDAMPGAVIMLDTPSGQHARSVSIQEAQKLMGQL